MINKEKLNEVNKEIGKIQIHHALYKDAVNELGLTPNDIIEVTDALGEKKTGYYNRIGIYYSKWRYDIRPIVYLNKINKDGSKSEAKDRLFGPFEEIRIINHNSEE